MLPLSTNLISELLQIYAGKFVVRVTVAIEGITRATGMAAAETIELAEDRARMRALAVLELDFSMPKELTTSVEIPTSTPTTTSTSAVQSAAVTPTTQPQPHTTLSSAVPPENPFDQYSDIAADDDFVPLLGTTPPTSSDLSADDVTSTAKSTSRNRQKDAASNVTPLVPRTNQHTPTMGQTNSATVLPKEPVDLSNVLARTDIELERLGWTKEQGRDYLIRTYNKRGRTLLTEQELLEFLEYLESQPSPQEPFS